MFSGRRFDKQEIYGIDLATESRRHGEERKTFFNAETAETAEARREKLEPRRTPKSLRTLKSQSLLVDEKLSGFG